jgi:hypothetical protein
MIKEEDNVVKLNLSELFDKNIEFDVQMLSVFTARDDLYRINDLILKNIEVTPKLMFLFKFSIGITKESYTLLFKLFKTFKNEFSTMYNETVIIQKYEKLRVLNNEYDKEKKNYFSIKVLKNIRNQTFHYCDTKEFIDIINKIGNIESSMTIGDTRGEIYHTFADELYLAIAFNYYKEYKKITDEKENAKMFIKELAEFGIAIAQVFDEIIDGFLQKKSPILI